MNKLNTLLSENMLRFGTKNLTESQQKQLIVKSIMETINQNGLRHEIRRRLNEGQSVPDSITLNYDNGMLRMEELYNQGDLAWDLNATFKGSQDATGARLTISEITFVPGSSNRNPEAVTVSVPLVAPFTMNMGQDAGGGTESTIYRALTAKFDKGIKLNLKSPAMTQVMAGMEAGKVFDGIQSAEITTMNMNIGNYILDALYAYCGQNGWYTGPTRDVAKMYAVFVNHDGTSTNFG